ncbi:nucleotidyltransferase family protein [Verrucomicrobiota bacterium sgz303538]
MHIGLILLAAGGSRRLGQPKQLLAFEGRTLLRRAAEAACGSICRPVVVVLGAEYERCTQELVGLPATIVLNPHWSEGMAGSIRIGLDFLIGHAPQTAAAVLCLCDQPHLTGAILDALVSTYIATAKPIIASEYDGVLGAPALFAASFFTDLRALRGEEGARRLFKRASDEVATVSFEGGKYDVDTLDDYQRLCTSP